jgi:GT2 family glycosyltransferase
MPSAEPSVAAPPLAASVVIAVRDRPDDLARALDSLDGERLEGGRTFEVIVVDDGSTEEATRAVAAARAARPPREDGRGPCAVSLVRLPRSLGPGAARNAAARHARAPSLVFLDSDARALPGWLSAMLAPLEDPAVGAVGGAEAPDPEEPLFARAVHFLLTSPLTTGGIRGRAGARAGRYLPRSFSMAVRRPLFEAAGGFPGLRNGEDVALARRVAAQGMRLVHAPEARVHHRRRPALLPFARQVFGMGRGRATLARRDPGSLDPAVLAPPAALLLGAALALAAALRPEARALLAALAALAALHLALVAASALHALRDPRATLLAPLLLGVQVASYALGFLAGLLVPLEETPSAAPPSEPSHLPHPVPSPCPGPAPAPAPATRPEGAS